LHSGLPGANLNDCAQQRRSAIRNAPAPPAFRGAGAKEFPILSLTDVKGAWTSAYTLIAKTMIDAAEAA